MIKCDQRQGANRACTRPMPRLIVAFENLRANIACQGVEKRNAVPACKPLSACHAQPVAQFRFAIAPQNAPRQVEGAMRSKAGSDRRRRFDPTILPHPSPRELPFKVKGLH
jgi:hypothetical protein